VYVQFRNQATAQVLAPVFRSAWSGATSSADILEMSDSELRAQYASSFERVESFLSKCERVARAEKASRERAALAAQRKAERDYAKYYHNPVSPTLDNRLCWTLDAVELMHVKNTDTKKKAALFKEANALISGALARERAERRVRLKLARKLREQNRTCWQNN